MNQPTAVAPRRFATIHHKYSKPRKWSAQGAHRRRTGEQGRRDFMMMKKRERENKRREPGERNKKVRAHERNLKAKDV